MGRFLCSDVVAVRDGGHGQDDVLSLMIAVTGKTKKDKAAKVAMAPGRHATIEPVKSGAIS
jgi:hypothetical protein